MDQKIYDLKKEPFSLQVIADFLKKNKMDVCNIEDCKQLVRATGFLGANYIETNEL